MRDDWEFEWLSNHDDNRVIAVLFPDILNLE